MKAISTTYHGPGNVKGARISASDGDGNRVSINYPDEATRDDAHWLAAEALCRKMGWSGTLAEGTVMLGGRETGCVFVWLDGFNLRAIVAPKREAA